MRRAVLFDLDGTLLHTPRAIVGAMQAAVAEATGEPVDAAVVRALVGRPLDAMCLVLATAAGRPQAADEVRSGYLRRFRSQILPAAAELVCEGVPEGLRELAALGVRTGVVTNKSRASADAILDVAGLSRLLDVVVGADDVDRPKPEPDALHHALDRLGADATGSSYVGDTAGDMHAARAAGMTALGVSYGVGTRDDLLRSGAVSVSSDFPCVLRAAVAS